MSGFDLIILDEAHTIRREDLARLRAKWLERWPEIAHAFARRDGAHLQGAPLAGIAATGIIRRTYKLEEWARAGGLVR